MSGHRVERQRPDGEWEPASETLPTREDCRRWMRAHTKGVPTEARRIMPARGPARGPGRPALPPEERRRPVNLTLTPETVLGLDVLAETRQTSRSGVVEALVREALTPRRHKP